MTFIELKNHPVWHDLTEVLENIDANVLIKEHLELSNYKICGYWDENDNYYKEIILPNNLETELISSSIGLNRNQRFIQLKFIIINQNKSQTKIAELSLNYNEKLEFINEDWYIDTELL